jgi:hypothetical protein
MVRNVSQRAATRFQRLQRVADCCRRLHATRTQHVTSMADATWTAGFPSLSTGGWDRLSWVVGASPISAGLWVFEAPPGVGAFLLSRRQHLPRLRVMQSWAVSSFPLTASALVHPSRANRGRRSACGLTGQEPDSAIPKVGGSPVAHDAPLAPLRSFDGFAAKSLRQ